MGQALKQLRISKYIMLLAIALSGTACLENVSSTNDVEFQPAGVPAAYILPGVLQTGVNIENINQLPAPFNGSGCSLDQMLQWNGSTWTCIDQSAGASVLSDNLGNHTATQNLNLGAYQLVGEDGSAGIYVDDSGYVGIGTTNPEKIFHVLGDNKDIILESNNDTCATCKADLEFRRSRNGAAVQEDDLLGQVSFIGSDGVTPYDLGGGVNDSTRHAYFRASVDGPIGNDNMPTRLVFGTSPAGSNDAVPRMVIKSDGDVGIGVLNPSTKLEVDGDVLANNFTTASDIKFKDEKVLIKNSLEKLKKLNGYEYVWSEKSRGRAGQRAIGVIAQEVELQFPLLIKIHNPGDANEYRSVNYQGLVAPIINAIKELDEKILDESEVEKFKEEQHTSAKRNLTDKTNDSF